MTIIYVILILIIPISLLLLAGLTVLQVYLSLRRSFWPGLVMPVINLLTILVPLLYSLISAGIQRTNGEALLSTRYSFSLVGIVFIFAVLSLLVNSITYLICRRRLQHNSQRELHRMSIQDLG